MNFITVPECTRMIAEKCSVMQSCSNSEFKAALAFVFILSFVHMMLLRHGHAILKAWSNERIESLRESIAYMTVWFSASILIYLFFFH